LLQAVIAGGRDAVWESAEGAEDSEQDAKDELSERGLKPGDAVIGIAASSSTPFVRGAMDFAGHIGCSTILITCNPVEHKLADVEICLLVGPEVIVGSTRLKSGTATKMVLNMITTTAMVQLGKTYGNLMVDLKPRSEKLRSRAVRIMKHICGINENVAEEFLERANWNVKAAVIMQKMGLSLDESLDKLNESDGFLYRALGEHE
jgi:N-acetylmuramic acid 6-phosphate etherase